MKALKLGTQTGSLINHLLSGADNPRPEVGIGATILKWTDREAGTVTEVIKNKAGKAVEVVVQEDEAEPEFKGMTDSQSYTYKLDPNGRKSRFTLRRNGAWVAKGDSIKGTQVAFGYRRKYHDFSF